MITDNDILRKELKSRLMTQKKMARLVGIDETSLSNFLKRKRDAGDLLQYKINKWLNTL